MDSAKSFAESYAQLGTKLLDASRFEDAVYALKKALAEPETGLPRAPVYLSLGKSLSGLEKDADALTAFSEAVRLDPDIFPEVEKEVSKLQARTIDKPASASTGKGFGDWFKGLWTGLSSRAVKLLRNMAIASYRNEKFAEAEGLFAYVLTFSAKDSEILEYLGWARLKLGKTVLSIESFRQAVAIDDKRTSSYQGLGSAYLALGQSREACEALQRALELKPDDPEIMLLQGAALAQLGDLEASEKTLSHVIELQPDNDSAFRELAKTLEANQKKSEAASALTEAARLASLKKEYAEAEALCEHAIVLDSSNGLTHLELGKAQIGQKRYQDALKSLERSAELAPSGDAQLFIARAYFLENDLANASISIDRALVESPDSPEALGLKGTILQRLQRNGEALSNLDKALALNPDQAQFHTERGHVFEAMERPADAIDAYNQAIKLDPKSRWAHARLGMILYSEKRYPEAIPVLAKALELQPQEEEISYSVAQSLPIYSETQLHLKRGTALYESDQYEQAIPEFDAALNLDPSNAEACALRGSSLFWLGRHQEAVEAFQLSLDLYAAEESDDVQFVYAMLGEALRELRRYRESKTVFKKAIALNPDDSWALARFGETLRMLDQLSESEKHLREAVRLDPKDAWALGALGATLVAQRKYRSSLEEFEKALELDPKDPFNLAYRGKIFREVKRYPQALEALDRSLEIDSKTAWVWIEKGTTLRDMPDGKLQEALSVLENAVSLAPDQGDGFYQVAICQYRLEDNYKALESINEAYKLDPSLDWTLCLKSLILNKLEQTDLAQQAHEEVLTGITTADAYFNRASGYGDLAVARGVVDAYEPAVKDLEETIRQKPDFKDAYNYLAWIHASSPTPRLDEALKLANQAVELDPASGDSVDTLGWVYFKGGMLDKALEHLEKAASLAPEDLEIEDHLESCRQSIRSKQEAASASNP